MSSRKQPAAATAVLGSDPDRASQVVFSSSKRNITKQLQQGLDDSPKGSIDVAVIDLVQCINRSRAFVTTSSCSGRVAIYAYDDALADADSTKGAGTWLYVNHGPEPSDFQTLSSALLRAPEGSSAILKVEPFILHVQCATLAAARELLQVAVASGYRESGIGIGGVGKIIVAVRTTASSLEVPLRRRGITLVSEPYMRVLVDISNERMVEIGERRRRFETNFASSICAPSAASSLPSKHQQQQNGDSRPNGSNIAAAVTPQSGPPSDPTSTRLECSGCKLTFSSRNRLFAHLMRVEPPPGAEAGSRWRCPDNSPSSSDNTTRSASSDEGKHGAAIEQAIDISDGGAAPRPNAPRTQADAEHAFRGAQTPSFAFTTAVAAAATVPTTVSTPASLVISADSAALITGAVAAAAFVDSCVQIDVRHTKGNTPMFQLKCSRCGIAVASRNALFRHLREVGTCTAASTPSISSGSTATAAHASSAHSSSTAASSSNAAAAPATATGAPASRVRLSPAGSDLLTPCTPLSDVDIQASDAACRISSAFLERKKHVESGSNSSGDITTRHSTLQLGATPTWRDNLKQCDSLLKSQLAAAAAAQWDVEPSSSTAAALLWSHSSGAQTSTCVPPPLRWGHSSVLLPSTSSPSPMLESSALFFPSDTTPRLDSTLPLRTHSDSCAIAPQHGFVLTFGGFQGGLRSVTNTTTAAGRVQLQLSRNSSRVHGRCSSVCVYDTAAGTWTDAAQVEVDAGLQVEVPRPRTRHSAVSVPFNAYAAAASASPSAMLVFGGHDGPSRALNDAWWCVLQGEGNTSSGSTSSSSSSSSSSSGSNSAISHAASDFVEPVSAALTESLKSAALTESLDQTQQQQQQGQSPSNAFSVRWFRCKTTPTALSASESTALAVPPPRWGHTASLLQNAIHRSIIVGDGNDVSKVSNRDSNATAAPTASASSSTGAVAAAASAAASAATSAAPAGILAAAAVAADSAAAAAAPPLMVVFGGRDEHRSFNDLWCAEVVEAPGRYSTTAAAAAVAAAVNSGASDTTTCSSGASVAGDFLPGLRWTQLHPSGTPPCPRFYHAAVALKSRLAVHPSFPVSKTSLSSCSDSTIRHSIDGNGSPVPFSAVNNNARIPAASAASAAAAGVSLPLLLIQGGWASPFLFGEHGADSFIGPIHSPAPDTAASSGSPVDSAPPVAGVRSSHGNRMLLSDFHILHGMVQSLQSRSAASSTYARHTVVITHLRWSSPRVTLLHRQPSLLLPDVRDNFNFSHPAHENFNFSAPAQGHVDGGAPLLARCSHSIVSLPPQAKYRGDIASSADIGVIPLKQQPRQLRHSAGCLYVDPLLLVGGACKMPEDNGAVIVQLEPIRATTSYECDDCHQHHDSVVGNGRTLHSAALGEEEINWGGSSIIGFTAMDVVLHPLLDSSAYGGTVGQARMPCHSDCCSGGNATAGDNSGADAIRSSSATSGVSEVSTALHPMMVRSTVLIVPPPLCTAAGAATVAAGTATEATVAADAAITSAAAATAAGIGESKEPLDTSFKSLRGQRGAMLMSIGGGGVAFAFGSQFSTTCWASLPDFDSFNTTSDRDYSSLGSFNNSSSSRLLPGETQAVAGSKGPSLLSTNAVAASTPVLSPLTSAHTAATATTSSDSTAGAQPTPTAPSSLVGAAIIVPVVHCELVRAVAQHVGWFDWRRKAGPVAAACDDEGAPLKASQSVGSSNSSTAPAAAAAQCVGDASMTVMQLAATSSASEESIPPPKASTSTLRLIGVPITEEALRALQLQHRDSHPSSNVPDSAAVPPAAAVPSSSAVAEHAPSSYTPSSDDASAQLARFLSLLLSGAVRIAEQCVLPLKDVSITKGGPGALARLRTHLLRLLRDNGICDAGVLCTLVGEDERQAAAEAALGVITTAAVAAATVPHSSTSSSSNSRRHGDLPRRVEWVGDILVLPSGTMMDPLWTTLVVAPLTSTANLMSLREGMDARSSADAAPSLPSASSIVSTTSSLPLDAGTAVSITPSLPLDAGTAVSAPVWDVVAAVFGAARVARHAEIDTGGTRASRIVMLKTVLKDGAYELPGDAHRATTTADTHRATAASGGDATTSNSTSSAAAPPPTSTSSATPRLDPGRAAAAAHSDPLPTPDFTTGGWTSITENGIRYGLDITRVMFSSGNGSEKARMGRLAGVEGSVVVDLFAGIGYFTLPLLVHARVGYVHACDWNPDALLLLRWGLHANGVGTERVTLWPGDSSRMGSSAIAGTADRVLLGLIPSSEIAWGAAVQCLKPRGGVMHVHANVSESHLPEWVASLPGRFSALAQECAQREWRVIVAHVEKVKSYAPHVWHVVADVECSVVVPVQAP